MIYLTRWTNNRVKLWKEENDEKLGAVSQQAPGGGRWNVECKDKHRQDSSQWTQSVINSLCNRVNDSLQKAAGITSWVKLQNSLHCLEINLVLQCRQSARHRENCIYSIKIPKYIDVLMEDKKYCLHFVRDKTVSVGRIKRKSLLRDRHRAASLLVIFY